MKKTDEQLQQEVKEIRRFVDGDSKQIAKKVIPIAYNAAIGTAVEEQPDVGAEWWISVDERTPETSGTYIVCCKEQDLKHVTFAKFYKKLGYWELKGSRTFWKVTHWMPLPEPPKESDKNEIN